MNNLDLGRALKAPLGDPEWVNRSLMGSLWLLLGVTFPVVYGAQLEYIRRVSRGDERLPDFDDFGGKWVQGLLVGVAGFLYFLPVLLVGGLVVLPGAIAAVSQGDSDAVGALLGGGMCVFLLLATIYTIVMSVMFSAAMTHYAMKQRFGAFFEVGTILQKVRGGTGYFTAWLYVLLISFGVSTITSVLSGLTFGLGALLALPASYLATMMMAHVLGQWARTAYGSAQGGDPTTSAETATWTPPAPPPPPPGL